MKTLKRHKAKIIACLFVVAILIIAFVCGGNTQNTSKNDSDEAYLNYNKETESTSVYELPITSAIPEGLQPIVTEVQEPVEGIQETSEESINENNECSELVDTESYEQIEEYSIEYILPEESTQNVDISEEMKTFVPVSEKQTTDEIQHEENSMGAVQKIEPVIQNTIDASGKIEEKKSENSELICTLSVRCDNAVGKSDNKESIVPNDGIIFAEKKVVFYEGESVFNILVREMKKNKIHLEFVNTPIYDSAYIEGIGNLYEFDCGELSGWMYKVNGWAPNYGCSQYELKQGDRIEWVYTCDLGKDVGGEYSARNGMKYE